MTEEARIRQSRNARGVRTPTGEWTRVEYAQLAALAHEVAGLVLPPNRRESAEDAMQRAVSRAGVDSPAALLAAARSPGRALDALLAELTIGESYFFRESAAFAFVRRMLAERAPSAAVSRPLRLWSAGCAGGEEPYSLAILLAELGWNSIARVMGTDISVNRLASARRGRYSAWALRGVAEPVISRWFARHGTTYVLDETIRKSVEFRTLNLADATAVANAIPPGSQDLIFCRNVLIYFDAPTVRAIGQRLLDSLSPDGWLILGASDPQLASSLECEVHSTGGGMAYRRCDDGVERSERRHREMFNGIEHVITGNTRGAPSGVPAQTPAPAAQTRPTSEAERTDDAANAGAAARSGKTPSVAEDASAAGVTARNETAAPSAEDAYRRADYERAEALSRAAILAGDDRVAHWVIRIRSRANVGSLAEADALCSAALERHRGSAELNYLHAMLLSQAGQHAAAAESARRAVYLDRHLIMAHVALGDALDRAGGATGARRALENAMDLLRELEPDAPVPASDGLTAGRLARIVRSRLGTLPDQRARP